MKYIFGFSVVMCVLVDHSLFKIVILLVVLSVIKHFLSYFTKFWYPDYIILSHVLPKPACNSVVTVVTA